MEFVCNILEFYKLIFLEEEIMLNMFLVVNIFIEVNDEFFEIVMENFIDNVISFLVKGVKLSVFME